MKIISILAFLVFTLALVSTRSIPCTCLGSRRKETA
jgi:hypothetical protein